MLWIYCPFRRIGGKYLNVNTTNIIPAFHRLGGKGGERAGKRGKYLNVNADNIIPSFRRLGKKAKGPISKRQCRQYYPCLPPFTRGKLTLVCKRVRYPEFVPIVAQIYSRNATHCIARGKGEARGRGREEWEAEGGEWVGCIPNLKEAPSVLSWRFSFEP